MEYKPYSIYQCDFSPKVGQKEKLGFGIIVSPLEINQSLNTITICPITNALHPLWKTRIQILFNNTTWEVAIDQIRTLSKQRLIKYMEIISGEKMQECKQTIGEIFVFF